MQTAENTISILLADDDKDDRFFFQEAFTEISTKTLINVVTNGEQLMEYLAKKDTMLPDIIFLDLNLPRKSGIESLLEIRKNNDLKNIIVAIYSTSASQRDMSETFANGANIYVQKPNDYLTLIKMLTKVINIEWKTHNENLTKENFLLKL